MGQASFTSTLVDWDTMVAVDDDFVKAPIAGEWTTTATDSGTATVADGPPGVLTLTPSDGSVGNNDEIYFFWAKQTFLFPAAQTVSGDVLYARARMLFLEAGANNAANIGFGFMSGIAANALIDDGGGPQSSTSHAVIYKVDGGTVWRCQARNGSEFMDTITTLTASDAAYHLFEVIVHDYTSTRVQVTYKVDGQFLKDSVYNKPIVHQLLRAAAGNMSQAFLMKNGEATTVQNLLVDRAYGHQARVA